MAVSALRNGIWILLACAVGIYFSLPIWKVAREHRLQADVANQQMRRVQAEQAEKIAEQARLTNPSGREEYVRRQGYKKPNERKLDLN